MKTRREMFKAMGAVIAYPMARPPKAKPQTITVNLELDGKKLAEAIEVLMPKPYIVRNPLRPR